MIAGAELLFQGGEPPRLQSTTAGQDERSAEHPIHLGLHGGHGRVHLLVPQHCRIHLQLRPPSGGNSCDDCPIRCTLPGEVPGRRSGGRGRESARDAL